MRGALRAPLIARERLMVIFARGRKIVPISAMSDAWLASKNTEHPPRARIGGTLNSGAASFLLVIGGLV